MNHKKKMGDQWKYLAFQRFWNICLRCFWNSVKARERQTVESFLDLSSHFISNGNSAS